MDSLDFITTASQTQIISTINDLNQFKVISFASPKVFQRICADEYPLGNSNHLRYYKKDDIVTWISGSSKFKHNGVAKEIDQFDERIIAEKGKNLKSRIRANHSLKSLFKQLNLHGFR